MDGDEFRDDTELDEEEETENDAPVIPDEDGDEVEEDEDLAALGLHEEDEDGMPVESE